MQGKIMVHSISFMNRDKIFNQDKSVSIAQYLKIIKVRFRGKDLERFGKIMIELNTHYFFFKVTFKP